MKNFLISKWLFIGASLISWTVQAGGEIGNAHFVDYFDKLNGFELRYPENWSRLELGSSVSLMDRANTDTTSATTIINIATDHFTEVKTPGDLKRYLEFFQPDTKWIQAEIGGRPAFQANHNERGLVYVLREAGLVAVIRFRVGPKEGASQSIHLILESLKFERQ